ncbi:MAG: rRNA-processing protein and EBNA1-binding protein ebp2, partial [Chaenotheca gracillima]
MSDKTTGSCLCGAISYAFTGAPKVTALCHCTDCQKWSGSAYTSNAVVPRSSFEVTRGTPKNWNVVGDSGKGNNHFFCS